jgi:hypothetical protein
MSSYKSKSHRKKNRADAQRTGAGGPKTEDGKRRAALNAIRHGVLSNKLIVLQSESEEEFEEMKLSYYMALEPANFMERELVDEMVWAKWRQRRAIASETASIDLQMDLEAEKLDELIEDVDDSTRTAHAIKSLANEGKDLALLSRYETRFHRVYYRALKELQGLQDRRRADAQSVETEEPAPEPQPENAKLPNELPTPESAKPERVETGDPDPALEKKLPDAA